MPNEEKTNPESPAESVANTESERTAASDGIPLVGIGASAGGLEALTKLFEAMPTDTGLAFLVVLHLDPTRESQMSSILEQHTAMPVVEIEDGMQVVPNHVYVIAPNRYLTLQGDQLQLIEPAQPRGHRHPVDVLFTALAAQRHERTIAIILSGTGTNGTQGLKEIKAAGGLILIQDPETARFDGMPQSAIRAGLADHILAPEAMPRTLLRYLQHGYITARDTATTPQSDELSGLSQLTGLLRAHAGHNFQSYKPSMLLRRIHRRMSIKNLDGLPGYIELLRTDPGEIKALAKDLLISVTSFFRDGEAWAALDEAVITKLVANRETGTAIRVWVPACASGEEAYSLAMLLIERAEAAGKQFELKIFASDLLDDNLNAAREGVYPGAAVEMLSPARLRRFFEKLDGSYQVRKELRDLIVFARQDMLRDPPFSRMDLISCRNLLIYIQPEVQKRAVALFHFALRESGYLFLGNAETIGRADDLFETVSKKWRIYRRIGPTRHDLVEFPVAGGAPVQPHQAPNSAFFPELTARATEAAKRALLDRYAPASVLIDQKGRILYFHGQTGAYLEQPTGEPTRDLLAMVREGLLTNLRRAIQSVSVSNRSTTFAAQVRQGDVFHGVRVTLSPLPTSQQAAGLILVTFEPEPEEHERAAAREPAKNEPRMTSPGLEEELKATRAELQSTIEQLEGANEEMKAANEEATSMNEELQSTNEELETSKEELQSFNEELHTVNNQLQHKIQELEDTSNDLANLLAGTEIATIFLDTEFRLKWFSPATKQLLNLLSSDIGRPIDHFAREFTDDALRSDAEAVLSKLTRMDAEIRSDEGKWFLRRVLPYRTHDNRIAGLVITFTDITESKRATDAVNEARIYAEAIVATARQPLVILDAGLHVRSANRAFYALFDTSPERTEGRRLYEVGGGAWNIPELRKLLEEVLPEDEQIEDFEVTFGPPGPDQHIMLVNARKLGRDGGREDLILLAMEDITERRRGENVIFESRARLQELVEALPGAVYTTDAAGRITSYNPAAAELWGRSPDLGTDDWCGSWRLYTPDGTPMPLGECPMAVALKEKRSMRGAEAIAERPDGVRVPFLAYPTVLRDAAGRVVGAVNMLVDITERKRTEAMGQRLAAIVASSDDAIISKDLNGIITSWNQGAKQLFGYTAEEIVGKSIITLIPPERHHEETRILEGLRRGEHIDHFETVRLRKGGARVWVSLTISPLKNARGDVIGASKIARDMTESRRAAARQEMLVGELNHRVKNVLATVQAIASQTIRQSPSLDDFQKAFEGRLQALARAHNLIVTKEWEGTEIGRLVAQTLAPYQAEGAERIVAQGPSLSVQPTTGVALVLILHELATNAAKYGALSVAGGKLEITWQRDGSNGEPMIRVQWRETGGPPVKPPARQGFGTKLIERSTAHELKGVARLEYAPEGVRCELIFPWTEFDPDDHQDVS